MLAVPGAKDALPSSVANLRPSSERFGSLTDSGTQSVWGARKVEFNLVGHNAPFQSGENLHVLSFGIRP
jgi:hypothetical protein